MLEEMQHANINLSRRNAEKSLRFVCRRARRRNKLDSTPSYMAGNAKEVRCKKKLEFYNEMGLYCLVEV